MSPLGAQDEWDSPHDEPNPFQPPTCLKEESDGDTDPENDSSSEGDEELVHHSSSDSEGQDEIQVRVDGGVETNIPNGVLDLAHEELALEVGESGMQEKVELMPVSGLFQHKVQLTLHAGGDKGRFLCHRVFDPEQHSRLTRWPAAKREKCKTCFSIRSFQSAA